MGYRYLFELAFSFPLIKYPEVDLLDQRLQTSCHTKLQQHVLVPLPHALTLVQAHSTGPSPPICRWGHCVTDWQVKWPSHGHPVYKWWKWDSLGTGVPSQTLSWWIILFPCGSHSGHLCISCKHWFFLPLVTPSEFSWGNHTPHSPPSPPQPMWFRQHWYALYSPHPVQGGQMTSVVTVNTHDQGCPWQFPFYLKQSELCLSPAPKGLQVSTGPSWDWIFISCFLLTH